MLVSFILMCFIWYLHDWNKLIMASMSGDIFTIIRGIIDRLKRINKQKMNYSCKVGGPLRLNTGRKHFSRFFLITVENRVEV